MELKTIVVDNSPELKQRLVTILSGMEDIMVCKSFDDAVAAMQYIEENPVDLYSPMWSCLRSAVSPWLP